MVFDDYEMEGLESLEFRIRLPKINIKPVASLVKHLPAYKLVKKGIQEAKKIKITITPKDWKRAGKIALIGAGIGASVLLGPQVLPLVAKSTGALLTAGKTILPKIITKAPTLLKNIPITGTTVKAPSPPAPVRPAHVPAHVPATPMRNTPANTGNNWLIPALLVGGFLLMQGGKR